MDRRPTLGRSCPAGGSRAGSVSRTTPMFAASFLGVVLVPDPNGVSLTFGAVERKRGHLVGLVRVHLGDALLYADTVGLDVADDRRAFAEEVVMLADGATVSA